MTSGRKEFKERKLASCYLEAQELNMLQEIRWRERKSESEIIRLAVQEFIKAHAEGNDTFKLDTWNNNPDFQVMPSFGAERDKWRQYYRESDKKDRTKLRVIANDLCKIFSNVDFNENRK